MEDQDMVIEAFTEMAPAYEESVDYELRLFWGVGYKAFMGRLLNMIDVKADDWILDIATGTAVIPRKLAGQLSSGHNIVGLDLTPGMLKEARQKITASHLAEPPALICGSGMDMPLQNHAFDVVICGLGTHHMEVPRLMAEVKRVLKPGGTFIMADVRATAFWRTPLGVLLLRALIWFYSLKLRQSASRPGEGSIEAYGLSMSETRAQAELDAFKSVLTTDEWQSLVESLGFHCLTIEEIPALRRIYPGGLILKAVVRQD